MNSQFHNMQCGKKSEMGQMGTGTFLERSHLFE